jgi:hypothetical protein
MLCPTHLKVTKPTTIKEICSIHETVYKNNWSCKTKLYTSWTEISIFTDDYLITYLLHAAECSAPPADSVEQRDRMREFKQNKLLSYETVPRALPRSLCSAFSFVISWYEIIWYWNQPSFNHAEGYSARSVVWYPLAHQLTLCISLLKYDAHVQGLLLNLQVLPPLQTFHFPSTWVTRLSFSSFSIKWHQKHWMSTTCVKRNQFSPTPCYFQLLKSKIIISTCSDTFSDQVSHKYNRACGL